MFEDIDQRSSVADVISNAHKITNFIYNHDWLLAQMSKFYGGDIIKLGDIRFVMNYIALDNLRKKRNDLKKLFKWWMSSTQAQSDKHWTRWGEINVWPLVLG